MRAAGLIALSLLAACASTPRVASIPRGGPATMRPYQVGGRWFTPKDDRNYDEKGVASWYGPGFNGKSTATGERFDQDGVTAAHKTLPLPSFVEVQNLDNGRVQLVRLNDRGPFVGDRIIDLSRRTAQLLEVDRTGTARVRVRRVYPTASQIAAIVPRGTPTAALAAAPPPPPVTIVRTTTVTTTPVAPAAETPVAPTPTPPPPPATPPPTIFTLTPEALDVILPPAPQAPPSAPAVGTTYVQIAALSDELRAEALVTALAPLGAATIDRSKPGLFRVRLGPFSAADAAQALARARAAGYEDARVVAATN